MNCRRILTCLTLLASCLITRAELTEPDHYLMSPNATAIGEYGAIPVSLFTGIPDISIPLYEASAGGHKLPVTLSYHGGGVRPDQHPRWVGLGWNLNAGGCISRTVNGIPDETFYHNVNPNTVLYDTPDKAPIIRFGYFYYGKGGATGDNQYPIEDPEGNIFYRITEYDSQPDRFTFDFLGIQGSFYYLSSANSWIVQSNRAVKIVFDINNEENYWNDKFDGNYDIRTSSFHITRSRVINNFKIIDEYGNEYFFGGIDDAVEYSVGFFSQKAEQPASTTWMLTKVKYTDGNEIKFNYQKNNYAVQLGVSEYYYTLKTIRDSQFNADYYNGEMISYTDVPNSGNEGGRFNNIVGFTSPSMGYMQGSLITPSYLKSISTNNWKINFQIEESHELPYYLDELCRVHYYKAPLQRDEYTLPVIFNVDGKRLPITANNFENIKFHKLKSIKVHNCDNSLTASYTFHYNDTSDSVNPRLALLEIVNDLSGKKHSFEYDQLEKLPLYGSYDIDHWGFYKQTNIVSNKNNSGSKVPPVFSRKTPLSASYYESSRSPSSIDCKIGSLTKIKYPTGGYSRFEYEINTYTSEVDSGHSKLIKLDYANFGGGIRIHKILNSPTGLEKDERVYREYLYYNILTSKRAHDSSGILLRPWKYFTSLSTRDLRMLGSPGYEFRCNIWTSGNINPISVYSESTTVGYTWVTEKYPDGSFSIYNYSNFDNGYADEESPDVSLASNTVVGLRINIPYSSRAPSRGLLLKKDIYDSGSNLVRSDSMNYKSSYTCMIVEENKTYRFPMVTVTGFRSQALITIPFNTKHTYKIPMYTMFPDSVVKIDYLDGIEKTKETAHTTYYRGSLPATESIEFSSGEKKLTEFSYLDDVNDYESGYDLLDAHKIGLLKSVRSYTFDADGKKHLSDFVRYGYKDRSPVYPDTVMTGKGDAGIAESIVRKFDSRFNVVQSETDGASPVVYVWGYKGAYPVAKIINARIADVEAVLGDLETFSQAAEPDFNKLSRLRSALPMASVYTYRFIPLVGLSEMTEPDGKVTTYKYDAAGRLELIKDSEGNFTDFFDYNYAR